MRTITEAQVLKNLPMTEAIRLVRESFLALARKESVNQPRRRMLAPTGAVLHSLAGAFDGYFGTKVYSTHAKYGAHFVFLLFEAATGKPLAMIEANHLGQIRTGAASAVATDLLARRDAKVLAIIGSGFQARAQLEAIAQVRKLREVRVWSRNAEKRDAFTFDVRSRLGVDIRSVDSAQAAVEGADIVVTATNAKDPVLESAWVAAGAHINAMGSNQPARRELPSDLIGRADWIAVDSIENSKIESGDLLLAWSEDQWKTPRLRELGGMLLDGFAREANEVTIFKSNGLGVQDVAVGGFVYEATLERPSGGPDPSRR